jgi:stalled ribosome rescue protein Dom34
VLPVWKSLLQLPQILYDERSAPLARSIQVEGRDIFEYFEEAVENYGSKLIVVSSDTREGDQFRQLGGIGAMLRYV